MTDLSKELGEIKRRDVSDAAQPYAGINKMQALNDRSRLLHIIEVEIPGMLRARVEELDKERRAAENYTARFGFATSAQELSDMADAIESLTKKEEG